MAHPQPMSLVFVLPCLNQGWVGDGTGTFRDFCPGPACPAEQPCGLVPRKFVPVPLVPHTSVPVPAPRDTKSVGTDWDCPADFRPGPDCSVALSPGPGPNPGICGTETGIPTNLGTTAHPWFELVKIRT